MGSSKITPDFWETKYCTRQIITVLSVSVVGFPPALRKMPFGKRKPQCRKQLGWVQTGEFTFRGWLDPKPVECVRVGLKL